MWSLFQIASLLKLGVPEELVELVKSFHDGMKARVRVDEELLEEFEVTNGLHYHVLLLRSSQKW